MTPTDSSVGFWSEAAARWVDDEERVEHIGGPLGPRIGLELLGHAVDGVIRLRRIRRRREQQRRRAVGGADAQPRWLD